MRTNDTLLAWILFAAAGLGAHGHATGQILVTTGNAPAGEPPGSEFVQVASQMQHSAALRLDGTLVVWGNNTYGQCNQPPLPPGLFYTKVATAQYHTMAMRS